MTNTDGCNERYTELCALSTAGALDEREARELANHVSQCPQCARLLAEYEAFASAGLAKLAAEMADTEELRATVPSWSKAEVKRRLFAEAARQEAAGLPDNRRHVASFPSSGSRRWLKVSRLSAIAASLLLIVALSYEIGVNQGSVQSDQKGYGTSLLSVKSPAAQVPTDSSKLASLRAELATVQEQFKAGNRLIRESASREEGDRKRIADLIAIQTSLKEDAKSLEEENGAQAKSLESLTAERANLENQLENTRALLMRASQDLENARQDRERTLLRATTLETEMGTLNERLRLVDNTAKQQTQFLTSDRDIRELMGARQLYIADVFDVNQDGRNNKAFGRVFYTKGKSLIFYAFDLDQQPRLREAKAFQAWGRSDAGHSSPVSLGIFYMDNEANRRWVLKADNPDLLEQISAVFVTTEPSGGSKKPSGKPFLFAYLRSLPPNHP